MVDYQYHGDDPSRQNIPDLLAENETPPTNDEVVLDKIDITVIKCADCDRPLLNLLRVGYEEKTTKVKVKCVRKDCGGCSWTHTIEGDYRFSPIKERDYVDSVDEMEDGTLLVSIKKHKVKK